jgi:hypothetical protein
MRVLIILSLVMTFSIAMPVNDEEKIYPEIVRNEFTNNFDKGYHFAGRV